MKLFQFCFFGCVAGWLLGVAWFLGLVLFLDSEISPSRWRIAGSVAIPWAVVGLVVGAANNKFRGPFVPVLSILWSVVGGVVLLANDRHQDGWTVLMTIPACLGGALAGMFGGMLLAVLLRKQTVDG